MNTIELYESPDGAVSVNVRADGVTVWLTQQQMATLFGRDISVVRRHVANARREELVGFSTSAKIALVQQEGSREVEHYNLDMIISVGYRVKSAQGVHSRKWASDVLRRYLLEGAAVNSARLAELGQVITILSRASDELVSGVADVLAGYLPGLTLLRDYDNGNMRVRPTSSPRWKLTIVEAREVTAGVAAQFPEDTLLGNERGEALQSIVETLYQGFMGQPLYSTVEEQAANLLYLVIKGHLIAMSDPKEKQLMVDLVVRMITDD